MLNEIYDEYFKEQKLQLENGMRKEKIISIEEFLDYVRRKHPTEYTQMFETYKKRIRDYMEENGFSQAELAQKIGRSAPYITKLLSPNTSSSIKTIRPDSLELFSIHLECTKWYLIGLVEQKHCVPIVDLSETLDYGDRRTLISPGFFDPHYERKQKIINGLETDSQLFDLFVRCEVLSATQRNIVKYYLTAILDAFNSSSK